MTLERVIDRIAGELGLDPAEVRRVNMVGADRFPYASAGGYTFDSGDYPRALDRLLELSDYAELRRTQDQMRRQGRYLGIGLGAYVEACGFEEWEAGRVTSTPTDRSPRRPGRSTRARVTAPPSPRSSPPSWG